MRAYATAIVAAEYILHWDSLKALEADMPLLCLVIRAYSFSTDHSVFYLSPTLTISRVSVNANRQSPIAISNLQSQFQIANRQCNSKSLIANRQSQVCSRSLLQLQVVTPHQVTVLSRSLLQLQIATLSLGRHPSGNLGRAEKVEPPKQKASKSPRGFDDLLPGFGSGGPASGSRYVCCRKCLSGMSVVYFVVVQLPKGTHQWSSFLTLEELVLILQRTSVSVEEMAGFAYDPLTGQWSLTDDVGVNFIAFGIKNSE
ncbi:hypothetical protein LXL04_022374 [Taraxacum kok-saghyz]